MQTNTMCEHIWSKKCFFRKFFIWGSQYANFSCANPHMQIPICKYILLKNSKQELYVHMESPFANGHCMHIYGD